MATEELTEGWVNVYYIERCYGGPEEGGWWYDELTFIHGWPFHNAEQRQLLEQLFEQQYRKPRYPLHSVLSTGDTSCRVEEQKAESETRERPIYE